jgi:hypothetical protein
LRKAFLCDRSLFQGGPCAYLDEATVQEGDIDPWLIVAALLAAAAISLAFFGFLDWRRRAARPPSRTGDPQGALKRAGSPVTQSQALDQISSSKDPSPSAQQALVKSWLSLGGAFRWEFGLHLREGERRDSNPRPPGPQANPVATVATVTTTYGILSDGYDGNTG